MEDYNIKYTMHNNNNNYPMMQPPNSTGHNGWMGDVVMMQTIDVSAIIQPAEADGRASENIVASGGGDVVIGGNAKTWADMVKKSGNCSSGETRFCVGIDHHDSNGVKTIGAEKRRSAANGRYGGDKPPRGGQKHNSYGGSGNFSSNHSPHQHPHQHPHQQPHQQPNSQPHQQPHQQPNSQPHPQAHYHMTTTQQLHLWQQQQQAALFQQQQQQQVARSHASVPQPLPPATQQQLQLQHQHSQPPPQHQTVHIQQQHPQQQQPVAPQPPHQPQQMQLMQVQQHLPGQAPAAGPPQNGQLPQQAIAHPQFFIPAAFSANSPNGAALMFPQPIMSIPALGHHMGQPPPMICTPSGVTANSGGFPPTGIDAVAAAAGGPIFVHPGFQDEKFRNTWLQQDCLPSVQWFNERCLQNYLCTHNNNIITAKERSAVNADNGSKECVIPPNLLASFIQFNGGGNATSAKPFHLKA